jgi:hypothetical protein
MVSLKGTVSGEGTFSDLSPLWYHHFLNGQHHRENHHRQFLISNVLKTTNNGWSTLKPNFCLKNTFSRLATLTFFFKKHT